jgi:4-hydroxythreonine-4-phosphate dehydrogenase
MSTPPRLVISLGDPCGIGPELLLRALPKLHTRAGLTVVGSRAGLDLLAGDPNRPIEWRWQPVDGSVHQVLEGKAAWLEVLTAEAPVRVLWLDPTPDIETEHLQLGVGSATSGRAAVEAVRIAAGLVLAGQADALVTLPLAKSAAHLAGFDIPGHTEYLQALAGAPVTRMAFVSPRLSVVLHTVHQSLRSVVETLNASDVVETLVFATDRFVQLTGKADLRVALCALNPHAGEQGAFGTEETILEEALARAQAVFETCGPQGPCPNLPSPFEAGPRPRPRLTGPWPADSLFHRAASGDFDLVVALYHDQGLIPVKVLEPERAVNLTLGLPFIRTSPDHGTAFDKAGRWVADPRNFLEAATLALRLAERSRTANRTCAPAHP